MDIDPLKVLGSSRRLTQVLGTGSQGIDRSIEMVNGLRVSGQNLVIRAAIEATRRAPDASGTMLRGLLRQRGVLTPHTETHNPFRDRLEKCEDAVVLLSDEMETDTVFAKAMFFKWREIAKTENPQDTLEPKTDADYVYDYAYVLQHGGVSELGVERIIMELHNDLLRNGGNLGVAEGDEPTLSPMVPSSEPDR